MEISIEKQSINSVSVFAASSKLASHEMLQLAYDLGWKLAEKGLHTIYGGGGSGLMGSLADGVMDNNGQVTGIIPQFLCNSEQAHQSLQNMIVVPDMHTRESLLMLRADAIIALPGSIGTYDELLQAIVWKRLGRINVPIIVINHQNYFQPLLDIFNTSIDNGLLQSDIYNILSIVGNAHEAMELI